ncbi:IMP dehydrogenase [Verrucomicrobiales bacterium BCK34]|nr:IMP dehydrogenase [Verrucomicrobiales bacterium BCK34]
MGELPLGLSFDDVLMVPQRSAVLPAEVDVSTRVTAGIPLNIPIISSAMDTVTEDELAIALAREGGLGVIHRNMPINEQADMVAKVKRSENTVISDPFTTSADISIATLQMVMKEKGVNGFPVVDGNGILIGMVTSRDIWYIEDESAPVSSVMTPRERLVTAKISTDLNEARRILHHNRIEKLPLVDDEGKLSGLITAQDIEKKDMFLNSAKDEQGRLRVGAAIGVGEDYYERAQAMIEAGADAVFIDAATGHTERVLSVIEKLRSEFGVPVVAGNVVTEEGAADLCSAGAAAVKVGVGPGSICTTRVIAGVGSPQFSAIQNVAKVCRERGVPVIADGGIRYSGDVVKAMAAGADIVMLGSLLAGCRESPGEMVNYQGRTWKEYRGMGSLKAMRKGSGDRYGQNSSGKLVAEGVEGRVPYRGHLADTVFQLLGGLRSGMGYVGAGNLAELRERATFVRITSGGLKESHAHDITITEEPVNYQAG